MVTNILLGIIIFILLVDNHNLCILERNMERIAKDRAALADEGKGTR
jgi:hypothetical protein